MPIYFRNTPVSAPFMFDSIGNHWIEEETCRPEGYPHYHYLQNPDADRLRFRETFTNCVKMKVFSSRLPFHILTKRNLIYGSTLLLPLPEH